MSKRKKAKAPATKPGKPSTKGKNPRGFLNTTFTITSVSNSPRTVKELPGPKNTSFIIRSITKADRALLDRVMQLVKVGNGSRALVETLTRYPALHEAHEKLKREHMDLLTRSNAVVRSIEAMDRSHITFKEAAKALQDVARDAYTFARHHSIEPELDLDDDDDDAG